MINDILAQVPWLKPFIAWAIAISLVILLLVVPTYYIILPLLQRLRDACKEYLQRLHKHHAAKREERRQYRDERLEESSRDDLLQHVDSTRERLWQRTQAGLLQRANSIEAQLAAATASTTGFTQALPAMNERLHAITDTIPRNVEVPVTSNAMVDETTVLRSALMSFWTCAVLLLAIISINTGMLSQILRDIGFIPQSLKYFNIPLYSVIALLITCVEAGTGVLHGVFSNRYFKDENAKLNIASTFAILGAVTIAVVEGMFYGSIVPSRTDQFTLPIIGYTLAKTDVFFLWGFAQVLILFGLGFACYKTRNTILHGTTITNLRRQVRRLTKETTKWGNALRQAERTANAARIAVAAGQEQTRNTDHLEAFLKELRDLLNNTPAWASTTMTPLALSAVRNLATQALVWLIGTTGAGILVIAAGMTTLPAITSSNPVAPAIIQAAVAVASGFLLGWREIIIKGPDWQKVTGPTWARLIGLILIAALTIADLILYAPAVRAEIAVLWTGNLLAVLLTAGCAYQLIPLIALATWWALHLVHLIMTVLETAYRFMIGIALVIASILVYLATIIAGPLLVAKGPRVLPQ